MDNMWVHDLRPETKLLWQSDNKAKSIASGGIASVFWMPKDYRS